MMLLAAGMGLFAARGAMAQASTPSDTIRAMRLSAGEADDEPTRPRAWIRRPQWDLGFMTIHAGGGLLYDVIAYWQDSTSKEQFASLAPELKLRDARLLFGGRFKTKRSFTWQAGVMYDAANSKWLVRQTGLMVGVPEIDSHFFIGQRRKASASTR